MKVSRRDLLKYFGATTGCYIAVASTSALTSCAMPSEKTSSFSFPQGVASADPQSDAIVCWTRIEGAIGTVGLLLQVSKDATFSEIIAEQKASTQSDLDYTIRVLVTGLESSTYYYYRFLSPDKTSSRIGRTLTAPAENVLDPLKIAVFSCQDFEQGYFTAYRHMIETDRTSSEENKINFVLHVGDFIYETIRGPNTISETDLNGNQITLYNEDGSIRRCGPLPSGGTKKGPRGGIIPSSLDDYRWLYKQYLSDPDLQEARALYPFVQTWDDHELVNDYWQSYHKNRSVAELKVAANQAWFEFIPAALSMGGRDVKNHHAKDFQHVKVSDAGPPEFDENFLSQEANNLAAIGSMTIYRTVSWGRMADLFVVDGRSYRGPRALPQELLTVGRHPYPAVPVDSALINDFDEGRYARGGNPPEEVEYMGYTFKNPRQNSPRGSMLGHKQKTWFKDGLMHSKARWKLLGLNVGLVRHGFDDSFRADGGKNRILWTDGWDGYPTERRELCLFLRDQKISNVVSLTGDRHANIAGLVYDDYDSKQPMPIAVEVAGCAVSAPCRLIIQHELSKHDEELAELVSFNGKTQGYKQTIMPSLNAWMLYGATSAKMLHDGKPESSIAEAADPDVNSHLSYVDTDAYGYYVASFSETNCQIDFMVIDEPIKKRLDEKITLRRCVSFEVPYMHAGKASVMKLKNLDGEQPLGGLKT